MLFLPKRKGENLETISLPLCLPLCRNIHGKKIIRTPIFPRCSYCSLMAERKGFEPLWAWAQTVFKSMRLLATCLPKVSQYRKNQGYTRASRTKWPKKELFGTVRILSASFHIPRKSGKSEGCSEGCLTIFLWVAIQHLNPSVIFLTRSHHES